MATLVGETIGRYKILEELGRGGMAVVYKAVDTVLERNVAIKMILPDQQQTERFLKRFNREAKILAQLSHPSIVKVLDYGDYQGVPYLVMEYVGGGSLSGRMGKPFTIAEAAAMLAPIARALHHAHQHKVIHRDVKPANILINEAGQPMLSDFGIARLVETDESQSLTGTGAIVGTPAYMSPEQIKGKGVDARTDVYSLGVVFFELVTGRRPYIANTPIELTLKHINDPTPRMRQFVRDLPPEVDQLIYKSMAKNAEDRFADMGVFAAALEKLAGVQKPADRPSPGKPQNPPEAPAKKKTPLGLIAGIAVVVVAAGVGAYLLLRPPAAAPAPAASPVAQAAAPTGAPATATLPPATETAAPSATVAPTATQPPTQAPSPTAAPRFPNAITRDNITSVSALPHIEKVPVIKMDWTADGNWLVDAGAGKLTIIDPATMKSPAAINIGNEVPKNITIAADSNTIYTLMSQDVQVFDLAKREKIRAIKFSGGGANSMALSPDGSTVALGMLDNKVHLIATNSGAILRTLRSNYGGWSVAFSPDGKYVAAGTSQGVLMWEAASGSWMPVKTGQDELYKTVVFSHDGKLLAGGSNGVIRVWAVETGEETLNLPGRFQYVNSLAFSPDDTLLVSGADDAVVRVHDMTSGSMLKELRAHQTAVFTVVFSPSGEYIASGANEGFIYLWGKP